jgi:spermidine/putrescine-binding protein
MKIFKPVLWIAAAAIGAGLSVTLPRAAQADEPTLNLFNWSDYISESIIDGFELSSKQAVIRNTMWWCHPAITCRNWPMKG